MADLLTLDAILEYAENADRNKSHIFYKFTDIQSWDVREKTLNLGGANFTLTTHALKQFLKKLKIPYNYFNNCSEELKDKEIREALEEQNPRIEYIFKIKDNSIYGIIPKQHHNTLTKPLIQKIKDNLPDNFRVLFYDICLETTSIRLVSTSTEFANGWIPAVDIQFSEVGVCPFTITSVICNKDGEHCILFPEKGSPNFKMPMTRFSTKELEFQLSNINTFILLQQEDLVNILEKVKETILPPAPVSEVQPEDVTLALGILIPSKRTRDDYEGRILEKYNSSDSHNLYTLIDAVSAASICMNSHLSDIEILAGRFLTKLLSLQKDAIHHNEQLNLTIANIGRLFKRHN